MIDRVDIAQTEEQSVTLTIGYSNVGRYGSEEWQVFHDVRIVGYTKEGELVCEKDIGNVARQSTSGSNTLSLDCPSLPDIITFESTETPCEENTRIEVSYYRGREEGEHIWDSNYRECEEGLPPEWEPPS